MFEKQQNYNYAEHKEEKMRCLLWGTGNAFRFYYHSIKYYELIGQVEISGITSNVSIYDSIGGYKFISKEHIDKIDFDVVVIMSMDKAISEEIHEEALALGICEHNIIPCHVLSFFGFTFSKYKAIKMNVPTIFAPCCWGGITYNQLGLPFNSPLINMYENHDDYLKFLQNPRHYMDCKLKFKELRYGENLKRNYPVAQCDDILLYFNHYISFEEAQEAWERRKKRIDWNNLFVMFFDEDPSRVEKFCKLPYEKKICFVPYHEERDNVLSVEYQINDGMNNEPFWQIVNAMAKEKWMYYDVFDLLLENKITLLAQLKH